MRQKTVSAFIKVCQRNRKAIILLAFGTLALNTPALAQSRKGFTTIDPPHAVTTRVTAVNQHGVVAGYYSDGNYTRGFVRQPDGTFETFAPKDANFASVLAINDAGTVVGGDNDARASGYMRTSDGKLTDIICPAGYGAGPAGINDMGVIAGTCINGSLLMGFVRTTDGTVTMFTATADAIRTYVTAINNEGEIAGYYNYYDGEILTDGGFVRAPDGTITTFQAQKNASTAVYCMNDSGIVGGSYDDRRGKTHGFLRGADGTVKSYDLPKPPLIGTCGMNAAGSIVGTYNTSIPKGYLRTPDGTFTTLSIPNSVESIPQGINTKDVIVGSYIPNETPRYFHGFLLKGAP